MEVMELCVQSTAQNRDMLRLLIRFLNLTSQLIYCAQVVDKSHVLGHKATSYYCLRKVETSSRHLQGRPEMVGPEMVGMTI